MSRKVEAWALVGRNGMISFGPTRTREQSALALNPQTTTKLVKFVPFDPDAARVLRLAEKAVTNMLVAAGLKDSAEDLFETTTIKQFRAAVERRQKRGAK